LATFSFFDFGIEKGLTRITAELVGLKIRSNNGFGLTLCIDNKSFINYFIIIFIPSLVNALIYPQKMQNEVNNIFFVLVLPIPIVSTSAGLRGILEAYQEFG
jgi:hypothetical protein